MEKNMKIRLLMVTLTFILAVILSGAVSAADNSTDNLTNTNDSTLLQDSFKNTTTTNSNLSTNTPNSSQTLPDPQIWRNGAPVSRGGHPAGYVYPSIAAAIADAQNGDTIMLEDGATFYERITVNKALTFAVFNNGRATIDGNDGGRVVRITDDRAVTFIGITFIGGYIPAGNGAGVYNDGDGRLTLINCTFINNNALFGGAVYSDGPLTMTGCDLRGNTANSGMGGAVFVANRNSVLNYNRIVGNTQTQVWKTGTNDIDARYNWWGSNSNPSSNVHNADYSSWTTISISASPGTINNGQQSTVTVQFSNSVPDGIRVDLGFQGTPLGTLNTNPTYTSNGRATAVFTANAVGTSHVNATVDSQRVGPANIVINPTAAVTMTKTSNGPVNIGQTGTFTITVHNNGPDSAQNVVVNDALPAGFTAGTPSQGSYNSGTGVWTIGTLANGATVTLTFTRTNIPLNLAGTTITNTATETQNTYNPSPIQPQTASLVINPTAVVTMTKTSNGPVNVGGTGTFTISVTNNGPNDAQNVVVNDILPAGFTAGTPSQGSYNSGTGVWTIGTLLNGVTATLTMFKNIVAGDAGTTITNTATETQSTYNPDPVQQQTATLYVPQANVQITQTSNGPVNVGGTGTFTITLHNNGPDTAHNVVVSDILPAGFTAGTPSQGSFSGNTWTVGDLASGATVTLDISGLITSAMVGTTITNTATETQDEYTSLSQTATASIYVSQANVQITQTSNGPVNVGGTGTFTITLHNYGPDTAHNVIVNDVLPSGFTAGTPSQGSFSGNTWTVGDIASGSEVTLVISGVITSAMAGTTITNTATETQDEYTSLSQTATANLYVSQANVQITQASNGPVNVGGTGTFTITLHNYGPDTAHNVVVSDILPSGFTAGTPSQGSFSGNTWTIGDIPSGATVTLDISGLITSAMAGTTITNTATETQDEYTSISQTATASIYVPLVNVQITQTSNGPVNVGGTGTFTITLHNNGPDTAHNVVVTDVLPSGFTAGTPSQGSFSGNTWTVGNIASGSEVTLVISGLITPAMAGTTIINTATETQDEYSQLLNQATANITVPGAASVVLHKEFRDQPWGNVITTANYHNTIWAMVEATNIGPNGTYVTINDILTGLNWTGNYRVYLAGNPNDPNNWILNDPANPFNGTSWDTYLGLLGGNTRWLAIECIINQTGSVSNFANITSQSAYAYNGLSNATATLNVPRQANVYIITTPSKTNPTVGENIVITVKVGNKGPDTAQGVVASYTLPSGFEFVGVTADAGITPVYNAATRTVTWTIGDVPVGDPYMYITLKAVSSGAFDNIAEIIGETTYDPNTDNKASSVIINVLEPSKHKAHAATKTIPLQRTGLPLTGLLLAVIAVLGGLVTSKRE